LIGPNLVGAGDDRARRARDGDADDREKRAEREKREAAARVAGDEPADEMGTGRIRRGARPRSIDLRIRTTVDT
jgi:hypothetical protein